MKQLVSAGCLALAACGSGPTVTAENASVSEVQAQVAKARGSEGFVDPGRWEATVRIAEISVPGMPPEVAARMKAQGQAARTIVSCLSPEDAKRPREDFFAAGQRDGCRYDKFTMGDGKIDAVMTCGPARLQQTMTMTGSYSRGAYDMTVSTKGAGASEGTGPAISMRMTMSGKRTGPCTGDEINKGEAAR